MEYTISLDNLKRTLKKEEDKLPEITEDEDEPTALAFTSYEIKDDVDEKA